MFLSYMLSTFITCVSIAISQTCGRPRLWRRRAFVGRAIGVESYTFRALLQWNQFLTAQSHFFARRKGKKRWVCPRRGTKSPFQAISGGGTPQNPSKWPFSPLIKDTLVHCVAHRITKTKNSTYAHPNLLTPHPRWLLKRGLADAFSSISRQSALRSYLCGKDTPLGGGAPPPPPPPPP